MTISTAGLIPAWHRQAACRGMDDEVFFGQSDTGSPSLTQKQVAEAKLICDRCPVFRECLQHSLEQRECYGVWAGTSRRTRLKLFKVIDLKIATVDSIVDGYCSGRGTMIERLGCLF
jgi:WhiB family redox-sensing transcriptional regulator